MKSRVLGKRLPEHKLQAANTLAESLDRIVDRFRTRFGFAKMMAIALQDESIFLHGHEQGDDLDLQKNFSLLNDSRHFHTDNNRQITEINPPSVNQQKTQKLGYDNVGVSVQFAPTKTAEKQELNRIKEEFSGEKTEIYTKSKTWGDERSADPDGIPTVPYESANLRIGDIVYFKNNVEISTVGKKGKFRMAGILSGDGIASNRLECIDREITSIKNANFLFKKSLFRVEPARKYYYQKLYKSIQAQQGMVKDTQIAAELERRLEVIKEKYDEEMEENDSDFKTFLGQNILYGQTIHLKHLYSDCYLTYQNNSLALQYGCIRLTLEEEGSEYSNFKFMASGNLKSKEDVVAYSDPIHVVSARGNYYMHVWDENNDLLGNNAKTGLEVNGSESSSDWKLLRFLDFEEYQECEVNNLFLESGDIVRLKHKKTNTALFVASRDLQPIITTKTITLNNELEDNFGAQRISFPTKFINAGIQPPPVNLSKARKNTISDLWEVQRKNAFIGGQARFDETFRLKNVVTGLFLCRDPDSNYLTLIPEGNRKECYFHLNPNKTNDKKRRIEYGDLMRVQTNDKNFVQKIAQKDRRGVAVGPKIADTTSLLFFMEYSDAENSSIANRLSSLFPCFFNFHVFLQQWGLTKDQTTYDYSKALEHEKSLGIEVDQLLEGLENLEAFLAAKSTFPFKIRQNLLIEQKIVEILMLIVELINAKVHTHTNQKNAKEHEDRNFKVFDENNDDEWELLEKTPQYIARKHLQGPIKQIYKILLQATKGSSEVSALILKSSKFLSQQLSFYRDEAGPLLKESIKNSANFGDLDPQGDQIAKWLGLVEMLKETEANVRLQTLYIEIVSLACLNDRKKGILKYQNRVLQEFFAPTSYFLKNILTFTKIDGQIYVSFGKDNADMKKEEFLENNYSFMGNEVEYKDYQGKFFFSLEDLSSKKTADLELIVNYISAVLSLFYSICKDRNQAAIERVKGMGLQRDVLDHCMNNVNVHIKMKKEFILLYRVLFMDVDPFQSIKEASNHCYLWDEIEQKKLTDYTYTWHNLVNGSNSTAVKFYDRETTKKICDYITDFWANGTGVEVDADLHWRDQEFLEKAELIYAMLLFTKTAINLGFTDSPANNQILYALINLFAMFDQKTKEHTTFVKKLKQHTKKSKLRDNNYWVSRFVQANALSVKHDTFGYIYLEALEIFKMIGEVRLNLQMTAFLKIFKIWHEDKNYLPSDKLHELFEALFHKYGLSIHIPKPGNLTDRSDDDDDNMPTFRWRSFNPLVVERVKAIVKEISNEDIGKSHFRHPEVEQHIQGGIIFINMLFEDPEVSKFVNRPTRDVLRSFFDQRECLLENLKSIEIISGEKEKEIYAELDDLNTLSTLVSHMLQDEDSLKRKQEIDLTAYKIRVMDINFAIRKIITYYKDRKTDVKLTLKTQNIMRNLDIHKNILQIFKVEYRHHDHREMFTLAIDALYHFCKKNKINQQALVPSVTDLLWLVEKDLKPAKLISQIFSYNKESKECHNIIETIFDHLAREQHESDSANFFKNHCQYIIMLRNFIVDEKKNGIKDNQRRVMGRLMTNKNFLGVLNFRPFLQSQSKNAELKDEELSELRYQSECMLLLANLTMETQLGMVQAKKTLSYDQIKSLLINNLTPYVQKRSFLRCLFQIYIVKYGSLNEEFDRKTMIDILNSVVIPDLKSFDKYVEGVIEIPDNEKIERQKKAMELRDRIKKFRGKLSDYEGGRDDNTLGVSAAMRKMLPPITSQADAKKLVRDASEYWEYLNSGKSWSMSQDGLLYFIMDCFHEIEMRNWMIDENLKEVLSNIKQCLNKMNGVLLKVEEELNRDGPTMKLTKFTVLIHECIDRLPGKKVVRLGKSMHVQSDGKSYNLMKDNTKQEEYDVPVDTHQNKLFEIIKSGDPVNIMLMKIKSFILKKKMSLEEFMLLFWNTEDNMPASEFKAKLKSILVTSVTNEEITEFINSIHHYKKDITASDGTVSLSKVYRKLQKSLERDRSGGFNDGAGDEDEAALEDKLSSESAMVSKNLTAFIAAYAKLAVSHEQNTELSEVIHALFAPSKKTLTKKRLERIKVAVANLITTFNKTGYEIYILRMLQYTLKSFQQALGQAEKPAQKDDSDDEIEQATSSQLKIGDFEKIQLIVVQSDALRLCLSYLKEGESKKLGIEAVRVLNMMLNGGNKHVQNYILEYLTKETSTGGFFNYIKLQLWETVDIFKKMTEEREKMRKEGITITSKPVPGSELSEAEIELEFKLTEEVIKLMQLFCENCFNGFQNFLRVQVTDTQQVIVPSNLVNELSSFLIDLQLADPQIFERSEMSRLVLASLDTLIDFCTGPCNENQILLGNQRHLISFLNSTIDKNINFEVPDNLHMIKIFGAIIKFLLSLITGNNDSSTKEFLLGQLHVDSLIKKLVLIYNKKIINRPLDIFRQERMCSQRRDSKHASCERNFCTEKLLTPGDQIIIETVFNLYIILTIFTDEFPDNVKLEKFINDKLKREERELMHTLQAEYHKHKVEKYSKRESHQNASPALFNPSRSATYAIMMAPKSGSKIVPSAGKIHEDDSTILLRDAQSPDIASPPLEIQKHIGKSHPPAHKSNSLEEGFKEDFVKRLMRAAEEERAAHILPIEEGKPQQEEDEEFKEYFNLVERHTLYKARKFFKTFINSVEIIKEDQISKNYFQVPWECDYMTENIREHLIFKANRNSDGERLEYFALNVPLYQKELKHRQLVSQHLILEWFVNRWRLFKDVAYLSVVANNIVLIATLDLIASNDNDTLNLIFSVIQIVLSVIVVVFAVVERLPISLYEKPFSATRGQKRKSDLKKTLAIEKNTTSLWEFIWRLFHSRLDVFLYSEKHSENFTYRRVFIKVIKDRENLYNLVYLLISIIALATDPLVYSILLLDIVKRSGDLQNIIKSITYNLTQLLKAVLLGLIVMYFYAIISFRWLRTYFVADDDSNPNLYCDKLLYCWTSVINYGVRSGGGIGDVMQAASMDDPDYWGRWIFDITFFILVIIILLNIIFGIIIDTFGTLRDERNDELKKISGSCFICGVEKYDFDTKGNGWNDHVYREHNIYAYLNFFIYIKNKKLTECNGIEKYVKELMEKHDISFIPQQTALSLRDDEK